MSIIKIGEEGKGIFVDAQFNVNTAPFTVLKIHFKSPDGLIVFNRDAVAPTADSPSMLDESGVPVIIAANTYAYYKTVTDDFTQVGDWDVYLEYQDATGSIFYGDSTFLSIGETQ